MHLTCMAVSDVLLCYRLLLLFTVMSLKLIELVLQLLTLYNREVIERKPEQFKISCMRDIGALFPPSTNPFCAGFGNKINVSAFLHLHLHLHDFFLYRFWSKSVEMFCCLDEWCSVIRVLWLINSSTVVLHNKCMTDLPSLKWVIFRNRN